MNKINLASELIGKSFYEQHQNQNETISIWLSHKLKHTFAVLSDIRDIFFKQKDIYDSFTKEEKELVELSAILHDLGRFYQHKDGKHLSNSEFDHGKYAVDFLKNTKEFNNPILLFAIEEHNRSFINYENPYYLPLSENDKKTASIIAKLLRDADKLENIKFFVYNTEDMLNFYPNIKPGPISDKIKDCILKKEIIPPSLISNLSEGILYHISWIYDVYFDSTINEIKDIDYINAGIFHIEKLGASKEDIDFLKQNLTF